MSTLSEKGLIISERYKEVFLTPLGRELAEFTATKHHIIRRFFVEVLRIPESIADQDACAIEHVISCESVRAMQAYMRVEPAERMECIDGQ
jgi:Mn-dependent DtxR family transcriptional regulator